LLRNTNDKKEYTLQNFKEFNFFGEEDVNVLFEIDEIFNRRTFFKTLKINAKKHDDLLYLDDQYMNEMWAVVDFDPCANTDPNNSAIFPFLLGSNKYPNSPSKMIRCENVLLFTVTRNKGFKLLNSTKVFLTDFDEYKTFNVADSKLKLLNSVLHKKKYTSLTLKA